MNSSSGAAWPCTCAGCRSPFAVRFGGAVERIALPRLSEASIDESLRQRLRLLYAKDVAQLRELTGKSLSSWSV